jgi:hypothetical protein
MGVGGKETCIVDANFKSGKRRQRGLNDALVIIGLTNISSDAG